MGGVSILVMGGVSMLDEHDSLQWYNIGASPQDLVPIERVTLHNDIILGLLPKRENSTMI